MTLTLIALIDSTSPEVDPQRHPDVVSFHVIAHVKFQRDYSNVMDGVVRKARRSLSYLPLFQTYDPQGNVIKLADDNPENILKAFCDVMFNQTTTAVLHIINPFRHLRSWNSMQFTSNLIHHVGLPVITWGPEYVTASGKASSELRQIQISPTLYDQAAAMMSLLELYNWPQFSVVYTTYSGHQEFLNALHVLYWSERSLLQEDRFKRKSKVRFQQLLEVEIQDPDVMEAVSRDLLSIASSDTRVILLFAHEQDTRSILEAAESLGIAGREYVWITAFEAIPKGQEDIAADLPVGLLAEEKEMKQAVSKAVHIWLSALNSSAYSLMTGSLPLQLPALSCSASRSKELFWPDGERFFQELIVVKISDGNICGYEDAFFDKRFLKDAASKSTDTNNDDDNINQSELSIVNVQPDEDGRNRWKEVITAVLHCGETLEWWALM
ncbi:hypothetical protein C0Q70_01855 [Pomacea canaliculata]|uniref:Receptor ligand binding region domain-containing protein n=1 Tax=Pomacea canaliculata TaxID=400727 RepID=A0A2T7Q0R0_POMCA|nr:hypothetical protein C0Q70_01855 [Pomacea canaliculata]